LELILKGLEPEKDMKENYRLNIRGIVTSSKLILKKKENMLL